MTKVVSAEGTLRRTTNMKEEKPHINSGLLLNKADLVIQCVLCPAHMSTETFTNSDYY